MTKTLTIRIKSADKALEEFRKTFKDVEAGHRVRKREGVYFTSIEAARNLLTPNRLALLRAVRSERPGSIYELSRMVNRDLKNVQEDLRILETYGLVRMADATRTGKRRVRVPRSLFDEIELKIAI
jgi:predicted transcriptional regulator